MQHLTARKPRILIAALAALAVMVAFASYVPSATAIPTEPTKPTPKKVVKKKVYKKVLIYNKKATCSKYRKGSTKYKNCILRLKVHVKKKPKMNMKHAFSDETLYASGVTLARAGEHAKAIHMFQLAENQQDPRILTMIGYSTRKLGAMQQGLAFYAKALQVDPNYVEAREYLGEALLELRNYAAARAQLGEIANRCGETCQSYIDLQQAMKDYLMQQRMG